MKRLLCAALILLFICAAASGFSASATAPEDTGGVLTVTVNGGEAVQVAVGNEFIVRVGLCAGGVKLMNGQVTAEYDPDYLSFVPYTAGEDDLVEAYSFPASVRSSNLILNYMDEGFINYNFTRISGVSVFNDTNKLFARFRFKAESAGSTDISHVIQYMKNVDDHIIYFNETPDAEIDPYTVETIEPSDGCVGDADGDFAVTIMDATYLQRYSAGVDLPFDIATADVTGDGAVSLKDAVAVRRYLAGKPGSANAGTWLFKSEMS